MLRPDGDGKGDAFAGEFYDDNRLPARCEE